jgi:hypothetical protein
MVVDDARVALMERVCERCCRTGEAAGRAEAASIGVPFESLSSLCGQRYVRHLKACSRAHRAKLGEYRARFERGESVVSIARSVEFSP